MAAFASRRVYTEHECTTCLCNSGAYVKCVRNLQLTCDVVLVPCRNAPLHAHAACLHGQVGAAEAMQIVLHVQRLVVHHGDQSCFDRIIHPVVHFRPKPLNSQILEGRRQGVLYIYLNLTERDGV